MKTTSQTTSKNTVIIQLELDRDSDADIIQALFGRGKNDKIKDYIRQALELEQSRSPFDY